jgi:hypothetical protein
MAPSLRLANRGDGPLLRLFIRRCPISVVAGAVVGRFDDLDDLGRIVLTSATI